MRDRKKTIESLRRLAERPGTPEEGDTAAALLGRLIANEPPPFSMPQFSASAFPKGTRIFYNYWAYKANAPGTIFGRNPKTVNGEVWLTVKFDHLKNPRSVPVTSNKGCHLSTEPLGAYESDQLIHYWR